jgi:hypothetical protein
MHGAEPQFVHGHTSPVRPASAAPACPYPLLRKSHELLVINETLVFKFVF